MARGFIDMTQEVRPLRNKDYFDRLAQKCGCRLIGSFSMQMPGIGMVSCYLQSEHGWDGRSNKYMAWSWQECRKYKMKIRNVSMPNCDYEYGCVTVLEYVDDAGNNHQCDCTRSVWF